MQEQKHAHKDANEKDEEKQREMFAREKFPLT